MNITCFLFWTRKYCCFAKERHNRFSKFSDLVNNLSSNLTLQEKFTEEISQLIYSNLDCDGVHVKVKAKHLCSDLLSPENAIGI